MKGTVNAGTPGPCPKRDAMCPLWWSAGGSLSSTLLSLVANPSERVPKSWLKGRALQYKPSAALAPALLPGHTPGSL